MTSRQEEQAEAVNRIIRTIPPGVTLIAAAKTRKLEEVEGALKSGVLHFGYNYVQEALPIIQAIGAQAQWHMIGHLQRNKAKTAVGLFDMIQTVDSFELAQALDRHCETINRGMPVLIEVNSGREDNKAGVLPEEVGELLARFGELKHVRVEGLMTMGPLTTDPQDSRAYFKTTRKVFEEYTRKRMENAEMRYLSMGMSDSYLVAIEEGANMVRIGTALFGARNIA